MEAFSKSSYQWQQVLGLQPNVEYDISAESLLTRMERQEISKFFSIKFKSLIKL
jgi:hypothetical protein